MTLSAMEFRVFIEHFPTRALEKRDLRRSTFGYVAFIFAQHGDYASGTRFRLSQKALADITGVSRTTVRKVLDLLERVGAIEPVDERPGSAVTYRLRRSPFVELVLEKQDRSYRTGAPQDGGWSVATQGVASSDSPPEQQRLTPWPVATHNKNFKIPKIEEEPSLAYAPEIAPLAPSARGAQEEDKFDELITKSWWIDSEEDLLANL